MLPGAPGPSVSSHRRSVVSCTVISQFPRQRESFPSIWTRWIPKRSEVSCLLVRTTYLLLAATRLRACIVVFNVEVFKVFKRAICTKIVELSLHEETPLTRNISSNKHLTSYCMNSSSILSILLMVFVFRRFSKTWLIICYKHIAKYYRSFGTRIASTRNGGRVTKVASL
jgi:hypothetical protein